MSDEDDGGLRQVHLAGRQSDAWEEFLMTGRPTALADYLQSEGPVDDGVRKLLIEILRNGPSLINKGGRDYWRDYLTFVYVNLKRSDCISKTKACRLYAEETNQERRTVELQYERGRKIYGPESDLFTKVDTNREK